MVQVMVDTLPAISEGSSPSSISELKWQCRRGMLELDILLNTFLDTHYARLDAIQRQTFSRLLAYPDQTLYELLMDKMSSADADIAAMVLAIRNSTTTG